MLGVARATWLRHLPIQASPKVFRDEVDKLAFLRDLGGGRLGPERPARGAGGDPGTHGPGGLESGARLVPRGAALPGAARFGAERLVGVTEGLVDPFDKPLAGTNAKDRRRRRRGPRRCCP